MKTPSTHPDYASARGRYEGISLPNNKFKRGLVRQAAIAAEVERCRARIDNDRRKAGRVSVLVAMSEAEARAVIDLIEHESRRRLTALTNGRSLSSGSAELTMVARNVLSVFPQLREERIVGALVDAGKRCLTNVEAATMYGVSVHVYARECDKRGIETAAARIRRAREEQKEIKSGT